MQAARRLGDPALIDEVINDLAGADPTAGTTLAAEAYGFAQLTCGLLVARDDQAKTAYEHLDEAARIAFRTGERDGFLMNFGPTNVAVWRVGIGVELQEAGKAYERAADIDPTVLTPCRRGWLYFDLARALAQEGGRRDADALRHLDLADQNAPQRIRHDTVARELFAELEQRAPRKLWLLDSLRHRFGGSSGTVKGCAECTLRACAGCARSRRRRTCSDRRRTRVACSSP